MNNELEGILYVTINDKKIQIEGDSIGSKDKLHEKREELLQALHNNRSR